ncbi:MAG: NUDIX hydrolase [Pseudomonadota bacterium]
MMSIAQSNVIRIAAAIIFNEAGHVLVVRKRGACVFMQPGGKIEPRELPATALARELEEEIALTINPDDALYVGKFRAPAANEQDREVEADVFAVPLTGACAAQAEIEEIRWVDPFALDLPLAILSRDHIMPVARARSRKESP